LLAFSFSRLLGANFAKVAHWLHRSRDGGDGVWQLIRSCCYNDVIFIVFVANDVGAVHRCDEPGLDLGFELLSSSAVAILSDSIVIVWRTIFVSSRESHGAMGYSKEKVA